LPHPQKSSYPHPIRFRAKFGWQGWFFVTLGILYTVQAVVDHHRGRDPLSGCVVAIWIFNALVRVLTKLFRYWEVDASSLRVRNFWSTKEFPWDEVIWVGNYIPSQPSSGFLQIDYARPAPLSERGHILANPEDRPAFLAALRQFAPQATFQVQ